MLEGDFNCILNADDSTGSVPFSKAIQKTAAGLGLYDAWDSEHTRRGYTHYAPMSASRLDRIYVTRNLLDRKQGMKVVATVFTDHFAVVIRLTTDVPIPERGRSYWKMNAFLLSATASAMTCKSDGQPGENMAVSTRTPLCGGPATSKNRYGNTSYINVPYYDMIVQSWKTSIMQPFMMLFEIPLTRIRPILH
jgi:hypothetical protein